MKKWIVTGIVVVLALDVRAEAPEMFRYQGRLVDGTNLVNATLPMSFKLYDAQSGGNLVYEDSSSVLVVDGLYSTMVGDNTVFGSLTNAMTNAAVYLELTVNGETLSPRERLVSVPYVLNAGSNTAPTGITDLTLSKLTVTDSAVLPSPLIVNELNISNLTGIGVAALKERRLTPMYGVGNYTPVGGASGASVYYEIKHTAIGQVTYFNPSPLATNLVVSGYFGNVGSATNYGCRINIGCKSTNPDGSSKDSATVNINPDINWNATNQSFVINAPLGAHNTNRWMQVRFTTGSNSADSSLLYPNIL